MTGSVKLNTNHVADDQKDHWVPPDQKLHARLGLKGLEFMEAHRNLECLAWPMDAFFSPDPTCDDVAERVNAIVDNLGRRLVDLRVDTLYADHGELQSEERAFTDECTHCLIKQLSPAWPLTTRDRCKRITSTLHIRLRSQDAETRKHQDGRRYAERRAQRDFTRVETLPAAKNCAYRCVQSYRQHLG